MHTAKTEKDSSFGQTRTDSLSWTWEDHARISGLTAS